jgi:hypothetical protein
VAKSLTALVKDDDIGSSFILMKGEMGFGRG